MGQIFCQLRLQIFPYKETIKTESITHSMSIYIRQENPDVVYNHVFLAVRKRVSLAV